MPNLLLDLEVDRVDLVDEGANSEAHIKLYKRKENQPPMNVEQIIAKMKPEHAEVLKAALAEATDKAALETELAKAKEELAKAKQDLEAKDKELEASKKTDEEDMDEEEVIKSLDPSVQAVFKSLRAQKDAAEAIAREAAEKTLHESAIAKARQLSSIPVDNEQLVAVVKGVDDKVFEILKAANDAINDSGLLDEEGVAKSATPEPVNTSDDAWQALEKAAAKIAEDDKISIEKAIGVAVTQNPELYRKYLAGGK